MKKQVFCGDVKIGGGEPVSIQSMTNTKTSDIKGTVRQIERLQEAGCQIVRVAVPDMEAAAAIREIKRKIRIPLVADIHFDYRLALEAIEAGADKIRINPGNIGSREGVEKIAAAAGERGIPIRVGVNSGSLEKDIFLKHGGVNAHALAESALRNVRMLEEHGFEDIVISLKSSDVKMNYRAYALIDRQCDYPLHIGVTEAGTPSRGKVKSAVGIGALLLAGIGDTMRVSLTSDPVEEVLFAKDILAAAGLREEKLEIISCPTCGRTEVDLEKIVNEVDNKLRGLHLRGNLKVAVMGCAVNGPGEAKGAHIGVACGRGKGVLFSEGKTVKTVEEKNIAEELFKMAEEYDRNTGKVY
ncbi:MAG TPA: flavodoxin-dependent (E)-4-hydroxy-3-methylbut-2-enyl-diphosphate synthase [Candidatus Copromorpha excrementigallinarum]|uniref:4-hydroxy-3-methylbut-2-en-1-yl diphosphate synthase (flavodoxin) n=1 Tax=Candidatus Allocopromorpha excrementigallinarum TaxID=2840742 RepID=A0A9D1L5N3_9FIRM|nr:flavodoxin-dependent (E)-4-hydroxy-3-methylbut-2-enyl-diphosphate synthase [Candidatus Copromorpha excrementigallinarum]